jgi:hypothetical protein
MNTIHAIIIFFIGTLIANAQDRDCMLGVGGSDSETIVQVFQLNKDQISKMNEWRAEFEVSSRVYQDEITKLFDTHAQSSSEDLQALSNKYRILKDKIIALSKEYDEKLLRVFNEKQYQRYYELCKEAGRIPLQVTANSPQPPNPE